MNHFLILHGWEATPNSIWFPEAKARLEVQGNKVDMPAFPGNYSPKLIDWLTILRQFPIDENWKIIGHSLGGVAALRYLEETQKPIKQLVLVATPIEPMSFGSIANFFETEFQWGKIKNNAGQVDLIYESDDPAVPYEHAKVIQEKLAAQLHTVEGGTHLCKMDLDLLARICIG